jgi:hypothetical protein
LWKTKLNRIGIEVQENGPYVRKTVRFQLLLLVQARIPLSFFSEQAPNPLAFQDGALQCLDWKSLKRAGLVECPRYAWAVVGDTNRQVEFSLSMQIPKRLNRTCEKLSTLFIAKHLYLSEHLKA